MPIVPIPRQQVATAPLPGVRLDPNAPQGAFRKPAPVDLSGAASALGDMAQQEQHYADQMVVNAAERQLSDLRTQQLIAATRRQGIDALGATKDVSDAWQQGVAEIRNSLRNDTQRAAFAQREQGYWANLYEAVESHAAAEAQKQDAADTEALLATGASAVMHDPSRGPAEAEIATARLMDFGKRNGWSDAETDQKVGEHVSAIHLDAIKQYLAKEQFASAQQYFVAHMGEMRGNAYTEAEHAVMEGSLRDKARSDADAILFGVESHVPGQTVGPSPVTSLRAGLERAREITDVRERAIVEDHIRQHFADLATADRQEREHAYQQASLIVEQTGDLLKVPLAMRQKLSPDERTTLEHRIQLKRNPRQDTNWSAYYSLLNEAALPQSRQTFLKRDLSVYRKELSPTDFSRLVRLQQSLTIREGNREQAKQDKANRTQGQEDMMRDLLRSAMNPEQRARFDSLQAARQATEARPRVPGAPIEPAYYVPKYVSPYSMRQHASQGPTISAESLGLHLVPAPSMPASVPGTWLDAARQNPNYAEYLHIMGAQP